MLRAKGLEPLAGEPFEQSYPRAAAHMRNCAGLPEFAPDLGSYLARIDASFVEARAHEEEDR